MSKFNKSSTGSKTVNHEGAPAFSMNEKFELASLVLTSFIEKKFYEGADDTANRIVELCGKVDGDFLGKLAVYARREGHMRSASHVLLAEYARLHKGGKEVLWAGFERPDDMCETMAYYGNKYGKPVPNALKKAIAIKITELDAYKLGKYKCSEKDVKMVDLFNMVHPKPRSSSQAEMWKTFLKGELQSPQTWEVEVSGAADDAGRKEAFERLIFEERMGYMALLRNLRNFEKYKITEPLMKKVADFIANPENVRQSKQLPFRFLNAYENVESTLFKDAISYALDASCANLPKFEGKTVVLIDISGSMNSPLSKKGTATYSDIALLFGMALWKADPYNTEVRLFNNDVKKISASARTPLIDLVSTLKKSVGGGTDMGLAFKGLAVDRLYANRVVVLSDMQAYGGHNANNEWERYKSALGVAPALFSIDLAGYGTHQFPENGITFISGWSEKVFDVMRMVEKGKDRFIKMIESYELPKKGSFLTGPSTGAEEEEAE